MRQSFRGVIGLAAVGLLILGALPQNTAAQSPGRLPSLLGIRVLHDTWRNVLAKYGQPTRIEIGAPTAPAGGQAGAGAGMMSGRMGPVGMAMPPGAMMSMMGGGRGLPGMPGMGPAG